MSDRKGLEKVIVNADDFGLSSSVNKAIVLAFDKGLISSTSIMANMPGFGEACALAERPPLAGRIGVHLNLIEGKPLTERIARLPQFCDPAGTFLGVRKTRFWLSRDEREGVEEELDAQIHACIERGIRPTHLDSHHHYHTEWAIGMVVIRVAKRNRIGAVRLSRNCSASVSPAKRLYKLVYNTRLKMHGLAKVRYFGSVEEVRSVINYVSGAMEIMVHPRLEGDGVLTDLDGKELEPLIRSLGIADALGTYGSVPERA